MLAMEPLQGLVVLDEIQHSPNLFRSRPNRAAPACPT
jgi:hypothetical protein